MSPRAPLAWRLAWRELRGGLRGFGVFLACLALGVAAIAAVGSLAAAVRASLSADAKAILGGDLELRQTLYPLEAKARAFLAARGRVAEVVTMRVMVRAGGEGILAELKAVGAGYPLYGKVVLASGRPLQQALATKGGLPGAVAAPELLARLGIKPGQVVRLGRARLRLSDVLQSEPDRASGFFALGPRLLTSRRALAASGLLVPGAVARYLYKVRLADPAADPQKVIASLRAAFPGRGWRLRAYASATTILERVLSNLALYLTLVSLAALLVGGIGVAGAVASYLEGRAASIAALKSLGARRRLVVSAYLLQTLLLALAGSLLGLAAGWGLSRLMAALLAPHLGIAVRVGFHPAPLAVALAFGLLTALAFSLWPLSAAGRISPARLFRGYADPARPRPSPAALGLMALCALALLLLALASAQRPSAVWAFAGAAAGSVALFAGFAALVRLAAARLPRPGDPRLRLALANLRRPGASTISVVFSLGLGLTVLVAVTQVEGNLQDQLSRQMPRQAPSFFMVGVAKERIGELRSLLKATKGVERLEAVPSIRGRVVKINRVPVEEARVDRRYRWALRSARGLSFARGQPKKAVLSAGHWWPPDYRGPPLISFAADIAEGFGVGVGDTLTLVIMGREVTAKIANLRIVNWRSLRLNHSIIFAPGVLEAAPYRYIATAYCTPGAEERVRRAVSARFPDLVVVPVKQVLADVSRLVGNVGLALRACAGLALLAGLLVLAQALRANLRRRHYEAVVLKVFGATRGDITFSLSAEFLMLGASAAALAALAGAVTSYAFMAWLFRQPWSLQPGTLALIAAGGVVLTWALGLAGVRGALSQKAWPILRNE